MRQLATLAGYVLIILFFIWALAAIKYNYINNCKMLPPPAYQGESYVGGVQQ
jgi:hypothetical protein